VVAYKPVYSVTEAFEALGVSRVTGYRLIQNEILKSYHVGKRRFVSGEALRECIDRMQNGAARKLPPYAA